MSTSSCPFGRPHSRRPEGGPAGPDRGDPARLDQPARSPGLRSPRGRLRARAAADLGPQRGRQDQPPRGDRAPGVGALAPDHGRRRADPLGTGPREGRGAPRRGHRRGRDRPRPAPTAAPGASGSGSTASAGEWARWTARCGSWSSPRRRCCWSPARPGSGGRRSTSSRAPPPRGTRRRSRPTAGPSSSGTGSCARSGRRPPRATSCASGTARFLDAGGADRRGPPAPAGAPRGAARPGACRDRDRRGGGGHPGRALFDERAGGPRRDAAGDAGPPAGRDRGQGGLERRHAHRAAPRRPGLRARRARPGGLRLARPAADRDPLVQAGGAGPADRAGRPGAAPAARRRLLRARPGPPRPPRAAHRRPPAVVRDHHDPRRPRPIAARDRHQLGGPGRGRPRPARRGGGARRRRGAADASGDRP